jgi:CubicO group peptidase (beta-lactamase class C family)
MKKKKLLLIPIILVITYLSLPKYAKKAIIFQKPGIEDYKIFSNRKVESQSNKKWNYHYNYNRKKIKPENQKYLTDLNTTALIVIQNGNLLYENYWNNYNDTSISNSFSVTKSIISILIGIAIDQGFINNDEQFVYEFIPEYNTKENRVLKIKHLLTMSSGLNWEESYGSLFNTTTEAYYGDNLFSLISQLEVIEPPGQTFQYLSGNTQILAEILKRSTNMEVSEFASNFLWNNIHAENTALWSLDTKDGREKAYCCFNSTAKDLARIGQLILNNGKWDSTRIISEEYIQKIKTPALHLNTTDNKPVDFYSYQWWLAEHKGLKIKYARGILGQYIIVIPEKRIVIVRLGHKRSDKKSGMHPKCLFKYIEIGLNIAEENN